MQMKHLDDGNHAHCEDKVAKVVIYFWMENSISKCMVVLHPQSRRPWFVQFVTYMLKGGFPPGSILHVTHFRGSSSG